MTFARGLVWLSLFAHVYLHRRTDIESFEPDFNTCLYRLLLDYHKFSF